MVFSTPYFLFLYLPMVLLLYYISPLKWRNLVLMVVNLIFYGWGEPVYIIIMLISIAANYAFGLVVTWCKRREDQRGAKIAVALSVVFNLALLGFFKYWDFLAKSLAGLGLDIMPQFGLELPIGISFYTFQTMSYTIDVYRGDSRVQKNIITFGTFVTLFPQLIAGPILQYKDLDAQLEHRDHTVDRFALGVQRFCVGLAKKVLLANNLGKLWDVYLATPGAELTTLGAWLGIVAFSLQLYFDFSGYSDMAIGLGRMLGFEFMENFNYPYISKSATEFWRRWGLSLYPPGRQPGGQGPIDVQPAHRVGRHRHLARGQLELPHLGPVLLLLHYAGKAVAGQIPEKGPCCHLPPLWYFCCGGGLGHLRGRGFQCYGTLPQGHVWHGGWLGGQLGAVLPLQLPAYAGGGLCGRHPLGRQGVAQDSRQGVEACLAGTGVSGPCVGHRLPGGRHLQPLPLFPILRR